MSELPEDVFSSEGVTAGDRLTITHKGFKYRTKVTAVEEDDEGTVLYIQTLDGKNKSALVETEYGWAFPDGQHPENIEFELPEGRREPNEFAEFSGSQLTDIRILALADDESFKQLCKTNQRLNEICTNPRYEKQLYMDRIIAHFPSVARQIKSKISPDKYKTAYEALVLVRKRYKRVEIKKYLSKPSRLTDADMPVLKLYISLQTDSEGNLVPATEVFLHNLLWDLADREEAFEMTKYLLDLLKPDINTIQLMSTVAVFPGDNEKLVRFLAERYNVWPGPASSAYDALINGNISLYSLLVQQGYENEHVQDWHMQTGVNRAAMDGDLRSLEWFKAGGYFPGEWPSYALYNRGGSKEKLYPLLEWYYENDLPISNKLLKLAYKNKDEELIQVLTNRPYSMRLTEKEMTKLHK